MELIFCIVLAGLLLFGLGSALQFSTRTVGTDLLKARGFPIAVIVLALIVLIILTIKHILQRRKEGENVFSGMGVHYKVLCVAGAITGYLALINIIGFMLSTLAFTFVNPLIMGHKKYRVLAVFSVLLTALIVLVFGKFFNIPLPRGLGFLRELSYYIY